MHPWRLLRSALMVAALVSGLALAAEGGASGKGVLGVGVGTPPHVAWTTFTDPYENAFKIEVPQGWRVAGGTLRKVSLLPNLVLRVLSPDRRTLIALGDADSAPYSAPIAARDYVRRFTERAMSGACSGLKVVSVSDLPDVEQLARSKSIGPYNQWSAAQASFTCNGERQAGMGGESIAVLQYMTTLRSGHAQILAAFVTTAGQEQAADQLWRAPDGHTVGTDTPTAPTPDATQLERLPE